MNIDSVIITPIISEKSQVLQEIGAATGKRTTKYTFKVAPDATKTAIKTAIRKIYNVTPSSVNIMVYRGKDKRFRNVMTRRPHWKKAIVTFEDGAKLEFGKGV